MTFPRAVVSLDAAGFRSSPAPRSVNKMKEKSDHGGCAWTQAARLLMSALRITSFVSTAKPAPARISAVRFCKSAHISAIRPPSRKISAAIFASRPCGAKISARSDVVSKSTLTNSFVPIDALSPTYSGTPRRTPWNFSSTGPTLRPLFVIVNSRMVFSCEPVRFLRMEIALLTSPKALRNNEAG